MTARWILAGLLVPALAAAQPAPPPAADEPATDPATEASDADIAALELGSADTSERLNIYGFMDVTWLGYRLPPGTLWNYAVAAESSFAVGNLNLYLTRAISARWRSFLEVRFMYAPAGATNADGTLVHDSGPDPANSFRAVSWGGVGVERAYLEYDATERLTVQVGAFLTPYGIWNVDHGSPAIIPINPPYVVGEQLFPKQQTGIHVYGQRPFGEYTVGYHATLSNGRGPFQAFRDLDSNKAVGGRLELEAPWLGATTIGLSGYHGRFTDRPANQIGADAEGNLHTIVPLGTSYDESSVGADVLIVDHGLRVQAEVLANTRAYRAGARALGPTGTAFMPDTRFVGGYLLAGYRLDRWWQAMPFISIEVAQPRTEPGAGSITSHIQSVGLNLRPVPSVALKMQYVMVEVLDSPILDGRLQALSLQAAWAF